jgi:hypothetical protein
MRRQLAVAVAIAVVVVAAPNPPAFADTGPDCTWHKQNDPLTHCLSVAATMTQAPVTGQTVPISFTIGAEIAEQGVQIEADLPGNVKWTSVPQGLTVQTVQTGNRYDRGALGRAAGTITLNKAAQVTFTGAVTATGTGSTEIRIRAKYSTALGSDTVGDNVYLTIGDQKSGFGIAVDPVLAIAPLAGTSAKSIAPQVKRVPAGPSPDATSCVTAGLMYEDSAGVTHPVPDIVAEVWDSTAGRLTHGVTGADGRFTQCFGNLAGGRTVSVHFVAANGLWQVKQTGTTRVFVLGSANFLVADGASVELGYFAPCDHAFDRLLWVWDTAYKAAQWTPGHCWDMLDTVCTYLTIFWSPCSTEGTFYAGGEVHLSADTPTRPASVLRQIAHSVMDDVYEGFYPSTPSCSPHSLSRRSSYGCAWVEGFADWYASEVLHDPVAIGNRLDSPTWGLTTVDPGDAVELMVGSALWRVADSVVNGYDKYGEGMDNLWYTFVHHRSTGFGEFWNQRIADGFNNEDTGALGSLYQATIDYGFRDYLVDYTSQSRSVAEPWPHLFSMDTANPYWSVVAAAPARTEDLILTLFSDRSLTPTSYLAGSNLPDRAIEFIAIDSLHRPGAYYYPRVDKLSGEGPERIIFAQGSNILFGGTSQDITVDIAAVRDVQLTAGVPATITLRPGDPYADGELYLLQSDAMHTIRTRSEALVAADSQGQGGWESFTYTPTTSGWYGLVVISKGTGPFTLSMW